MDVPLRRADTKAMNLRSPIVVHATCGIVVDMPTLKRTAVSRADRPLSEALEPEMGDRRKVGCRTSAESMRHIAIDHQLAHVL